MEDVVFGRGGSLLQVALASLFYLGQAIKGGRGKGRGGEKRRGAGELDCGEVGLLGGITSGG